MPGIAILYVVADKQKEKPMKRMSDDKGSGISVVFVRQITRTVLAMLVATTINRWAFGYRTKHFSLVLS